MAISKPKFSPKISANSTCQSITPALVPVKAQFLPYLTVQFLDLRLQLAFFHAGIRPHVIGF